MNQPLHYSTVVLSLLLGMIVVNPGAPAKTSVEFPGLPSQANSPKIQAAILLDVSNSMDGLIEQAKDQLWNMVSVMGKVKCADGKPQIEIALYEYGRAENNPTEGYVKQITGFTSDLDMLFKALYGLTTHGGEEYCGHVLYNSLDELSWDSSSSSYKVIFIAGNEDFLQGDISYTKACAKARTKGIIVNTIYCGPEEAGFREHWNFGAECGHGRFTNINQQATMPVIPTPYDSTIITLNRKLNETFIAYGENANESMDAMMGADTIPVYTGDMSKIVRYTVVKSDRRLRNNSAWDLVDATDKDSSFINKVDMSSLPDSLKKKSREELRQIVDVKAAERIAVQKEITDIVSKRELFYKAERSKFTHVDNTLGTEIEKIIREQVTRVNMRIE